MSLGVCVPCVPFTVGGQLTRAAHGAIAARQVGLEQMVQVILGWIDA